jgi:hypothetical protein
MTFKRFFQNSDGDVVIIQPPNLLLSVWLVLSITNALFLHDKPAAIPILATATLFAWTYNELRAGDSPFRRVLGAVVLVMIIVGAFIR